MKGDSRTPLFFLILCTAIVSSTSPPSPNFQSCFDSKARCVVHITCLSPSVTTNTFTNMRSPDEINSNCFRYLIIRANSDNSVEVEFRDDTMTNANGVKIKSSGSGIFLSCIEQGGEMTGATMATFIATAVTSQLYDHLYCKFNLKAAAGQDIANLIPSNRPIKIDTMKIEGLDINSLTFPCDWNNLITMAIEKDEQMSPLEDIKDGSEITGKKCPSPYFNWFQAQSTDDFGKIDSEFSCPQRKLTYSKDGTLALVQNGRTKCTRPKCAMCFCPFCNATDTKGPQFVESDGHTCTKIKCGKNMLIKMESTVAVHPNSTLNCYHDETGDAFKWGRAGKEKGKSYTEGYNDVMGVECIDDVSCVALNPLKTECPSEPIVGKNCTKAILNGTDHSVCDTDQEIWYAPVGQPARKIGEFMCNGKTGSWKIADETYIKGSNVYCLKAFIDNGSGEQKAPTGANAGIVIAIICGVAVVAIIIIGIVVFCLRKKMAKKGNDMKSVSVTGKKSKKSSSSKTSEPVSAPPPPPCPDTMTFLVEPELPPKNASAQKPSLSEAGASTPQPVGPDTGKPDKPAELVDLKSEKKKDDDTTKKDASKTKEAEATVANTVTGTSIASKAEPTDPSKTDATTKKKENKEVLNVKKDRQNRLYTEMEINEKGLTNDDDYNIDDGVKPVNTENMRIKAYKPAEKEKEKVKVELFEDENGKLRAKHKVSMY